MPYACGGFGAMFGFGWIFSLIIWILIIWAIVAIIRHFAGYSSDNSWRRHGRGMWEGKDSEAMEILRQRYAKGEISKEEYEARKKDLMS